MLRADARQQRASRGRAGAGPAVRLGAAETCCGVGGTFAVKQPEASGASLAAKLNRIAASGAQVCTAGDDSCLTHIGGGLRHRGSGVRAVHLAEILAAT